MTERNEQATSTRTLWAVAGLIATANITLLTLLWGMLNARLDTVDHRLERQEERLYKLRDDFRRFKE